MNNQKYVFVVVIFFLNLIFKMNCQKEQILYKCGVDEYIIHEKSIKPIPINHNDPLYRRRLDDIDKDGFKKLNIYLDLKNIIADINNNNLLKYQDLFINSLKKGVETLQALLKVKPIEDPYQFTDEELKSLNINEWDKEKFGNEASNKNISTISLGIDLIIFGRFEELGIGTLASAGPAFIQEKNGQPIVGLVKINPKIDYSKGKSKEYFQAIILHEFTHILGFNNNYFSKYFHNILTQPDKYGIIRNYINSTKVIQIAKKYFNCSDLVGVELENYGGNGTAGSHWEARILLGEYMNGVIYNEEQVVSEFTLALLEDSGYYKANYYTGGLMRYGKNKGCAFLKDKCINENHEVNTFFENEFFDSIYSKNKLDPSCSSGRQSRTYNAIMLYSNIPQNYQYFINSTFGGWASADYCPVPHKLDQEENDEYYVGHCSSKGSGGYGSKILYESNNHVIYNKSEELYLITGETYSDHSFCFLSSLTKNDSTIVDYFSKVVRSICYEIFCSPKSLTIKIHDDYIVCPRAGGKIKAEGYKGYFLCPDYNLMCSGTVLCNDMFDCVEKKSEIKADSYIYDYTIRTSQNIESAEIEEEDNITNYELSENGTCPIYCTQCKEDKKCIKCKNDCNLLNGKCIKVIKNCEEYNITDGKCIKCIKNYAFIEKERDNCTNIENFNEFYTKDDGISFYPCDGEEDTGHIKNCRKCNFNKNNSKLQCYECKNNFILIENLEEINNCYSKEEVDNNHSYFYINQTHASKCSKAIKNCNECLNDINCIKCEKDFYLINNNTERCYNINELGSIDEYYLAQENTTYFSCNNSMYNSIKNCKKCISKDSCFLCQDEFTFIDGNKSYCFEIIELGDKYIKDFKDNSSYIKCSNFINNCFQCNSSQCYLCENGYIFINDNFTNCILKSSLNLTLYYTNDNITYYSCEDERYKYNNECQAIYNSFNSYISNLISISHKIDSTNLFYQNISLITYKTSIINSILISNNINSSIKEPSSSTYIINSSTYFNNFFTSTLNSSLPYNFSIPIISIKSTINSEEIINNTLQTSINSEQIANNSGQVINNSYQITINSNQKLINSTIPITSVSTNKLITIIKNYTTFSNSIISSKFVSTSILNKDNPMPIKIFTIYILQPQIIENILKVYILIDFPIFKNTSFTLNIFFSFSNSQRNLQQAGSLEKEITVYPSKDYNGNNSKIVELQSDENFNEELKTKENPIVKINDLNINNPKDDEIYIKKYLNNNKDYLDTQTSKKEIKNGIIPDYSTIYNKTDYIINKYKIISSTKGCNFNLICKDKINSTIKNINLNFLKNGNKNNKIKANCSLSTNNDYQIPCTLKEEANIYNNYILEEQYTGDENQTILITNDNNTSNLKLNCSFNSLIEKSPETETELYDKKGGLNLGQVIGIIIGIIFGGVVIIIVLIFCIYKIAKSGLDSNYEYKNESNNKNFLALSHYSSSKRYNY